MKNANFHWGVHLILRPTWVSLDSLGATQCYRVLLQGGRTAVLGCMDWVYIHAKVAEISLLRNSYLLVEIRDRGPVRVLKSFINYRNRNDNQMK